MAQPVQPLPGVADRAAQQHHELLPADPHQPLLRVQDLAHRAGDVADRTVAGQMAVIDVDALEIVEIQQRQGQRFALVAHVLEDQRHPLHQPCAVGQSGQAVAAGGFDQPLHAVDHGGGEQGHQQDQHQTLHLAADRHRAVVDRDQLVRRFGPHIKNDDHETVLRDRHRAGIQRQPAVVAQCGHADGEQIETPHHHAVERRHRVAEVQQRQHQRGGGDVVGRGGVGQPVVAAALPGQRQPDLREDVDEDRSAQPDHQFGRIARAEIADHRQRRQQQGQRRQQRADAGDQQFAAGAQIEHDLVRPREQGAQQIPLPVAGDAHALPKPAADRWTG